MRIHYIKENTEVEDKARETLNPTYTDAMRHKKDLDKHLDEVSKDLEDRAKKVEIKEPDSPMPIKDTMYTKQLTLSESLFTEEYVDEVELAANIAVVSDKLQEIYDQLVTARFDFEINNSVLESILNTSEELRKIVDKISQ